MTPERLQGYWIFRGEDRSFLFDETCADYFGVPYNGRWVKERLVLELLSLRSMERYFRLMDTRDLGIIIFEDIEIVKGRNKGAQFIINGSILSRFADGRAKYAVGYLTSADSSFSEIVAHEIAGDGFFSWSVEANLLHISTSFMQILGYEEHEVSPVWDEWIAMLVHPEDREVLEIELSVTNCEKYGDSFEYCLRLLHKNGFYIWTICRGMVLARNRQGKATSVIGVLSDINMVQDNFNNIKQLLYTDTLTGLYNRSYFQYHIVRWQDISAQPVSVIYVDVTGLKITNDVLGHADGDILLLSITDILRTQITRPCEILRLVGDEFLVLMQHCPRDEVLSITQQLQDYLAEYNKNPQNNPVFAGLGCATLGEVVNDTLHMCIERADVRMQAYKDEHRIENYAALKAYLEKRKGRPVSMRDGRRLDYMSAKERANQRKHNAPYSVAGSDVEVHKVERMPDKV